MSTDMVGFTAITHEIGNERVYDLLQHVLGIAADVVEAHGGHVIDTAGDGILAAFGAPQALENAALQSCAAALVFHKKISAVQGTLKSRFGVAPSFRTGIAGGNAMIAHQSGSAIKVVGDPVNQAARLQALAGPNEVLLTDSIRQEVEGFVATTDHGTHPIKGFDAPVQVHALSEMLEAVTRFEGTKRRGIVDLISRQVELDQVLTILRDSPALVLLTGVAGIGKSRLTYEIISRVSGRQPTYVGQCAPTGQAPLAPVYDILRQVSGQSGANHDLLSHFEDLCDPDLLATVQSPDTDDLTRAVRERELLAGLLRKIHARDNAVFVIEDTHWADSATNDLLGEMAKTPLPVILTSRPTADADWMTQTSVTRIDLQPLADDDIQQIVEARFAQTITPALGELIAAKSEGIPLIAEEISRALQHGDQLVETDAGLDLGQSEAALVTGNLEQLVLSRVDRLPGAQKAALQVAATIGRDFSEGVLRKATGADTPLGDLTGLIEDRGNGQWRFAHALMRDAVYCSLLSGQRRKVHGQVAEALETLKGQTNNAQLADHFTKAENPAKAVHYLIEAARESLKAYALSDVETLLSQAMEYLRSDTSLVDPQTFGDMILIWIRAMDQIGRFGRVLEIAEEALPLLNTLGLRHEANMASNLVALALTHVRAYKRAESLALDAMRDAEAMGDDHAAAWSKLALMRIYEETFWRPPDHTIQLGQEIAPVAAKYGDNHLGMMALYQTTSSYRSAGFRQKAMAVAQDIATFSEQHDDMRGRSYSLWALAMVYTIEGSIEETYQTVKDGRKHVIPGTADDSVAYTIEIYCDLFRNPPQEVKARVEAHLQASLAKPDKNLSRSCEISLMMIAFKSGRYAEGWARICTLLDHVKIEGNVNFVRQLHLVRAEILLTVLGLIDPDAEMPVKYGPFPKDRPTFRDLWTLLKMRAMARRVATDDLLQAITLDPLKHGVHFARAKTGLGLLAMSGGRKSEAVALLQEGFAEAKSEGFDRMCERAEAALIKLGHPPEPR